MTHPELAELYELYILGVLDPAEGAEIETHLAQSCAPCAAGMKRALAMNAFLAAGPEPLEPPARLRRRVLASVGAEPAGARFWTAALGFAAACLALLVLFSAIENRRRGNELDTARGQIRRASSELSQAQSALRLLNQPETRQVVFGQGRPQPPRGRMFVNSRQGVLLLASNLPPAPSGRIYEMWFIPKGGAPRPAGLFQSDPQGNVVYVLNGPVDPATAAVAVTEEPAAGSQAPTTKPVIVAALSD